MLDRRDGSYLADPPVGPGDLRAGLSSRKVNTLRDFAERLADRRLDMQRLSQLPDDDFMAEPGDAPATS